MEWNLLEPNGGIIHIEKKTIRWNNGFGIVNDKNDMILDF